ncbi:hypothetical protein L596_018345 [Steinernema carpocapsae]|uniref:Ubiquitin-like protease family profile domain-containing protein n=1 Tax=Steinernema carpocapsae TaxID=34508 RepID=A0A4U5N5D3_STECR|nr:hypothetical protein L596_018345 [Steinernema carpocapsae]
MGYQHRNCPNFITAAQRVIPLRDASLWSGTKSAQKNNERQGELQPSTLSWATQSRQSEGNDINGEFLFEATPKKPWMTAVADLQKAESAQKEDNSGEEELVEDEEDDLVVLGVYPALPSEDFFDDTLMTPDSSQKHIQRFKEEFSKTTSRRRTEEVGSSSASVDTSGRSTPATIQSTLSNSTVDDCMILGALEACDERRYENKYRRYNEHRRMNTKTIGAGNAMTRFSEIGFRSQSRMFKELDSLTLDLKRSLRIEGLRLERLELPEKDEFPPIPAESIELIGRIWGGGPLNEVFGKSGDGTNITRKDLMTLKGLDWLNDEIVNCYLNMICERAKENPGKMPKVHAYNTFFYPNLTTKGYTSVRRWTRRVDIFAHDLLIVPVHLGAHWCLAIVDVANKAIQYYDSMLGNNPMALSALKEYLEQEAKDKKKEVIDTSGWKLETRKDIPRQMNGSDCGMFACKFAEYASRRAPINFTQHHMPYFRQRMVHEICTKRLM